MTARNRRAYLRGLRIRVEIHDILAAHSPLLPPLRAKDIRARLTIRPLPAVRTVQWHMSAVRTEAILAELDMSRSAQFIR